MSDAASALRTPLVGEHVAASAQMTDFAGWYMPLRYDSELAEHHAVRRSVGLFDLTHMGEVMVRGPQAGSFLDYALVGCVSQTPVLGAKYSMICDPSGGIIDDLIVYRLADDQFMVVANASNARTVSAELIERAEGFAVDVVDESQDWCLIAVQGPLAVATLTPLIDINLDPIKYYAIAHAHCAGVAVMVARTGYTGEDGFELFCSPDDAVHLWRAIAAAGEEHDLRLCGLACRDSLRLEAGMPLYGNELSRDLTPYEAGLGRVVALDKPGSFVGREALERVAAIEVTRIRVGLKAEGRRGPRTGYEVLNSTGTHAVGRVTSGAPSPTLGYPIAMAYVERELSDPGTAVVIDIRGSQTVAEVVPLPFYKRVK